MKRFVTSYEKPDGKYGGTVDALDLEHAQAICDERGLGETVEGVLWLQVPADGRTNEDADRLTKALAETYTAGDEPPEADEFQ